MLVVLMIRVGQNHKKFKCTVYVTLFLAGKSPNAWSYTVYRYTRFWPAPGILSVVKGTCKNVSIM